MAPTYGDRYRPPAALDSSGAATATATIVGTGNQTQTAGPTANQTGGNRTTAGTGTNNVGLPVTSP